MSLTMAFSARSGARSITASRTARCIDKDCAGPSFLLVEISKLVRSSAFKTLLICTSIRLREARSKPWFRDTLFVFVADHCASVAGKTRLPVANYRIPLLLYAPGLLKPGTHASMISQIDIVPSLVDALGKPGRQLFYGRSVFEAEPPLERAFISNYQELGYLRNGKLTVLLPKRRVESFDIDPKTLEATPAAIDPQLLDEAIAYYQSASAEFRSGRLAAPFYAAGTAAKTEQ